MNCNIEVERNYSEFTVAGTFRFLLGLALFFAGLYSVALSDFQGHGLGFFLVFAAPFIVFKDDK